MLSILIPTYNYNVFKLVREVELQAAREHINFEIIVVDDASTNRNTIDENQNISLINNCHYLLLDKNIGRSKIRNLLARKAKYNWLLFLDADTIPVKDNLISNYLQYLSNEEKVVYGGIQYQEERPTDELLLRWVYGRDREALQPLIREQNTHLSLLTMNFAISKSVFDKVVFNENITHYGYEDVLFSYNLSRQNIKVQHIHNPVCHLGLEESDKFIRKTEDALGVLKYLIVDNLIPENYLRISKLYSKIVRAGLKNTTAFVFNLLKKQFVKNLSGKHPSLLIFDVYRLGYLCTLK
jgi:GT2 family glycosyltransferase